MRLFVGHHKTLLSPLEGGKGGGGSRREREESERKEMGRVSSFQQGAGEREEVERERKWRSERERSGLRGDGREEEGGKESFPSLLSEGILIESGERRRERREREREEERILTVACDEESVVILTQYHVSVWSAAVHHKWEGV